MSTNSRFLSRLTSGAVIAVLALGPTASIAQTPVISLDPDKGSKEGSPLDDLPDHIRLLDISLPEGTPQRADWSPDSERLIFLDAPLGNVWEYEIASGSLRNLTEALLPGGVLRAHHLSNGDLIVCAPEDADADDARFNGTLWVLRKPLGEQAAVGLGEACWEGVAASKQPGSTLIAWNQSTIDFTAIPDVFVEALAGESKVFTGRVVYDDAGVPLLDDKVQVLDKSDVSPETPAVEAQDFRRLDDGDDDPDDELIFSAYFHNGGQTMGVDLATGEVTDYSPTSPYYEEAEGIDPAGEWVLVERDLAIVIFPGELDIWRLALDGSGQFERLTTFNHYIDHGATNPVVSPDRTTIAFQLEKAGSEHGEGHGLLLFDLAAFDQLPQEERPDSSPPGDADEPGAPDDQGELAATGSAHTAAALLAMALAGVLSVPRNSPTGRRRHRGR